MSVSERRGTFRSAVILPILVGSLLSAVHAQNAGQAVPPSTPRQLELPATDETRPGTDIGAAPQQFWTAGRYRLTASDVIELRFPYVPEFDQTVTVQPDGYISLRALGDLRVQGHTLPELREMLNEAYAGILREPVINIILKEFEKPYFIAAGEVAHPGKYELRGATTLTQGLVLAGGQTGSGKHSQVVLFRRFSTDLLEVKQIDVKKMYADRNLSEDPVLRPGDTIFVPKNVLSRIAPFIPRPGLGLYVNPASQ
jgi:polysaccharide export outer membrane protein